MTTSISTYEQQANDFLEKTGAKIKISFLKYDYHFNNDKDKRDIYRITILKNKKRFSFNFGNSIHNTNLNIKPTNYDILGCLQKYDVGTFENFCDEFGYNSDSISALKTYKSVCKEYSNLCKLFSDTEIELLQEIQ